MADITRSSTPVPSLATRPSDVPACNQIQAPPGENLSAGDMVYIKAADGKFYKANGTAADALALAVGMVLRDAQVGEDSVTAFHGVEVYYAAAANLSGKSRLYVSATAGALADAATTGGTVPVAIVTDARKGIIYVLHPTR